MKNPVKTVGVRGEVAPWERRRFLASGLALTGGLLLQGCGGESRGTGAGPERLRVAYQSALAHRGILLAATGYAQRALGVPVTFTLQASGPAISQMFAQGQLDVAYMGPVPALIAIDKGVPIRMVAANHWYGYSVVGRKGEVKTVAELGGDRIAAARQFQGKTIGAFAKGSSQDIICRWFFAQAGMREGRDYTIRNYQGPDAINLMRAGALDGFVEYFENVAIAVREGYDAVIRGEDLWPGIDNFVVVRQELLERYPAFVDAYLRVDADVARFATAYPKDYARLAAPVLKVTEADAVTRITFDTRFCPSPDDASLAAVFELVPAMKAAGYLTGEPTQERAMDLSHVRRVVGPARPCDGKAAPDASLYHRVTGR